MNVFNEDGLEAIKYGVIKRAYKDYLFGMRFMLSYKNPFHSQNCREFYEHEFRMHYKRVKSSYENNKKAENIKRQFTDEDVAASTENAMRTKYIQWERLVNSSRDFFLSEKFFLFGDGDPRRYIKRADKLLDDYAHDRNNPFAEGFVEDEI